MARPKRNSVFLEKAQHRAAGLLSIDTALDLGNGLTLSTYSSLINDAQAKLFLTLSYFSNRLALTGLDHEYLKHTATG